MIIETKKLPVVVTAAEKTAMEHEISALIDEVTKAEAEKKAWNDGWKERVQPKDKRARAAVLAAICTSGIEQRPVKCEWRDGLVNGTRELWRLDTNEIAIDPATGKPFVPDEQEELFDGEGETGEDFEQARPTPPVLRWTGFDAAGVAHPITAEQFDAAEREIKATGSAVVFVGENSDQRVTLKNVVRARACHWCGQADGNHRQPECDQAKADSAADFGAEGFEGDSDERLGALRAQLESDIADDYDRNDTAAVAAKIAEVPPPNDRPLPSAADATRKVTPKRTSKKANGAANDGAGE